MGRSPDVVRSRKTGCWRHDWLSATGGEEAGGDPVQVVAAGTLLPGVPLSVQIAEPKVKGFRRSEGDIIAALVDILLRLN